MSNLYPENDWRDFLEHSAKGQKWAKHKYIAIENGRYIYPRKSGNKYTGQDFRSDIDKWFYDSGRKKKAFIAREKYMSKKWRPLTGQSLNSNVDYNKIQEEVNSNLDRQDRNFTSAKNKRAKNKKVKHKYTGQEFRNDINKWFYDSDRKKKAVLAREAFYSKKRRPLRGESLNSSTDYNEQQRRINANLDRQDRNSKSVKTKRRTGR